MLDTFCILCLDGLKSDRSSVSKKTFSTDVSSEFTAVQLSADSLAELCVDWEDLRVAHKGESKDGNSVRGLPGTRKSGNFVHSHGKTKCGNSTFHLHGKKEQDKQSQCSMQLPTCELMVNKCVAQWESSSSWATPLVYSWPPWLS